MTSSSSLSSLNFFISIRHKTSNNAHPWQYLLPVFFLYDHITHMCNLNCITFLNSDLTKSENFLFNSSGRHKPASPSGYLKISFSHIKKKQKQKLSRCLIVYDPEGNLIPINNTVEMKADHLQNADTLQVKEKWCLVFFPSLRSLQNKWQKRNENIIWEICV